MDDFDGDFEVPNFEEPDFDLRSIESEDLDDNEEDEEDEDEEEDEDKEEDEDDEEPVFELPTESRSDDIWEEVCVSKDEDITCQAISCFLR